MYKIRAAQIDLNRQKEPMSFIKSYTDFIAENGYNHLAFYIGWKARLPSYPWPPEEDLFSPDEIREIVSYTESKGLKLIPVVDLTHLDYALQFDELKKYQDTGYRFFGKVANLCFANQAALKFLENYITQLSELVPSEYFHIGGDEAFDIGYCDKCRKEGFDFDAEQELFLNFVLRFHDVIKNKLKRRMIMWDDMLEFYPDILSRIPTDVIMANWQYQRDVYCSAGHFGNRKREHLLAEYDRLGFEYLIAPVAGSTCNGRSYSDYARGGENLLGGIMTTWCTNLRFMYKAMPTIASIGRYWESDGKIREAECFKNIAEDIWGTDNSVLPKALRVFTEKIYSSFANLLSERYLLNFDFYGLDYSEYAKNDLASRTIQEFAAGMEKLPGKYMLEEILICLKMENAAFELKKALRAIVERYNGDYVNDAFKCIDEIKILAGEYSEKWQQWRPGILPNNIALKFNQLLPKLEELVEKIAQGNYLKVLFCQTNPYGAMQTKISIKKENEEDIVAQDVFKGNPVEIIFYERIFPLEANTVPRIVRFESRGYGGQGVAYVSARIGDKFHVPRKIVTEEGSVSNAVFVLDNDCKSCLLGESDVDKTWRNRDIAEQKSAIEVELF